MAELLGLSLIHEAETSDDDAFDIVAVHGLSGHSFETWTSRESGSCWLRDFLPESIPKANILTFGYDSRLTNTAVPSISSVAQSLLKTLTEWRRHDQEYSNRPLIFVGHSLGGLVVKQALLLASESLHDSYHDILNATSGIVFLGTPHRGSSNDIARVLQYHEFVGTRKGELNARGPFAELSLQLGHIQEAFQEFHTQKLLKFQIISFFEELPVPGFGLVVDKSSANVTSPSFTFLPIHADYETICRFASPSGTDYQRVLAELRKITLNEIEKRSALNAKELPQGIQGVDSASRAAVEWILKHNDVDNGSSSVNSAYPETCEWIFENKKFKSWLDGGDNSMLCIQGNPGAGKSTLLKHIIQNLEDRTVGIPRSTVASFFFQRPEDTAHITAEALFQSLIVQILLQTPCKMSDFIPMLSQQQTFCTKLNESSEKWRPWRHNNLYALFENVLRKISETYRICFFFDGLDEYSEEDSLKILPLISFIDSSRLKNPIKLCITSRAHSYLEASYRTGHRKIVLENENTSDIQRYIQSEITIARLVQFPRGEREELIVNEIVAKSVGVFLWVKLVVAEILQHNKDPIERLESSLLDLPSDLDSLYSIILDQIIYNEHEPANLAEKLLKWVCYARRPLSIEEISHALGVDTSLQGTHAGLSKAVAQSTPALLAVIKNKLLTHCRGLLEVREPDDTVHFIHYTVREFLVNTASAKTSYNEDLKLLSFRNAHYDLAKSCLFHLSIDTYASCEDRKAANGFIDYATDYWHEHTKLADYPGVSHMALLKISGWPSTKVLNHWMHLHQKRVGNSSLSEYRGWTALHASAAFGLHNLALAILDVERSNLMQWDIGDAIGRTPLSLAAKKGHLPLVKLLLGTGASIATRDIRYGFSPLMWAALQDHHEAVKLLIQKGADVNDSTSGSTPVWIAAATGHEAVLKLLLDKGANPNLANAHYGWTPLHLAAGYGNEAAISLLLAHGADPNAGNCFSNQTPLYYATAGSHHESHREVVKLLLDHGSGMQQQALGPAPDTPISWADRVTHSFLRLPRSSLSSCPIAYVPAETNSPSSSNCQRSTGETDENSKRKTSNKRPREVSESGSDGGVGGSGNDPNKKITLDQTPTSSNGPRLKLACPYFKYDPRRYSSQKLCCGPAGWPSVNRLKEHLHNRHFVHVCQRCCRPFKDPEDLEAHSKAATPCSARPEREYGDGFDVNQQKLLLCRTDKRKAKGSELEYWKIVYRILFPRVSMSSIPSPWYNEEEVAAKTVYDEACARVRNQDPHLRSQLLQLVHDPILVDPIINIFNKHQEVSVGPVPTGHDTTSLVTSGTSQSTNNGGLPIYQPPPLSDAPFNFYGLSFPPTLLLPQESTSQADSGFYSGSFADLSANTEGDALPLQPQQEGYGYMAPNCFNFQGPAADQSIRVAAPDQSTANTDRPEPIDDFGDLFTWNADNAPVSGISQKQGSSSQQAGEGD